MMRVPVALSLGLCLLLGSVAEARTRQHSPHHRPAAASSRSSHNSGSSSKKLSKSGSSHRGKKKKSKQRYEPPPQMPVSLQLLSLDLVTGAALVEAYGTTRVPLSRLFVLTDDRGRRFVPQLAECEPPAGAVLVTAPAKGSAKSPALKSGKPSSNDEQEQDSEADQPELSSSGPLRWRCHLVIPPLYRRAVLTGVTMEWGHLAVAAAAENVQQKWSEARKRAPLSVVAERAHDAVPPQPRRSIPEEEADGPAEPETPDAAPTEESAADPEPEKPE